MTREDENRGERLKSLSKDFDSAHQELNERDARYRHLVELAVDAIFMGDTQGNIIGANQSAVTLTGYSLEELLGKNLGELFSEEEHKKNPLRYDLLKAGKIIQSERMLTRKDGCLVPIGMNSRMMPDGTYHTFMRDYTERKRVEDELQKINKRFHDVTALSPLPIVITDAKGGIEFFNNKFTEIYGYTLDDISTAEQWWAAAYPDEAYRQEVQVSWTKAIDKAVEEETQIETQEWEITCKDGSVRCTEFNMMPLGDISVVVMNDITERKKAEALIKESNEELDAFVHTVAHDLRNPLTPIIGYAEILRENYKDQLDEQGLSFLIEIEKAGVEMLALMENLLTLAKSGTLKRPVERVSTDEVVAGVIKNLETNISSAGAVLQITPLPSVHVPKTFLVQIFDNLIGNALRYACKSGGLIEVGGNQSGKNIRFFVRDHGPGISDQDIKHIFEIFYRGTNKRGVKGSGVGLAIVYKIARNCGGRAWVEETQGGGCTFWVEMEDVAQA